MKIVIRGSRKTGKTSLYRKISGQEWNIPYESTGSIQVNNMRWNFKDHDDVIKLEIWDVVDDAMKSTDKVRKSVKRSQTFDSVDSKSINVYNQTDGVIFMMDLRVRSSFDYVAKEILLVPPAIPILIVQNFADSNDANVVHAHEVEALLTSCDYRECLVQLIELSMYEKAMFHKISNFIDICFLLLQRKCLVQKLSINEVYLKEALEKNEEISFQNESKEPEEEYVNFNESISSISSQSDSQSLSSQAKIDAVEKMKESYEKMNLNLTFKTESPFDNELELESPW